MKASRVKLRAIIAETVDLSKRGDVQFWQSGVKQEYSEPAHNSVTIAAAMAVRYLRSITRDGGKRKEAYQMISGIMAALDKSAHAELDRRIAEIDAGVDLDEYRGFLG
jgi:hypothetical protein